jgi:hypothetical protein
MDPDGRQPAAGAGCAGFTLLSPWRNASEMTDTSEKTVN